jgi:glutamine amidotransferase-like uncharacterized protein
VKRLLLLLSITAVLISACGDGRQATSTPLSAPIAQLTDTLSPTNTALPTDTALPPTDTPQPANEAPPTATLPPPITQPLEEKSIVFVSTRDGNPDLYVLDLDSGDLQQLTHTEGDDANFWPAWSPSGEQIAFESTRDGNFEIYLVDANGDNLRRLTTNSHDDMYPAWSPDGTQITFDSMRGGNFDIYRINANGTQERRLTDHPAFDYTSDRPPGGTPNGDQIAFGSKRSGDGDIYVLDLNSGELTRLTTSPGEDYMPAWSPDGTQIAFASERDGNWEIYLMDADGSAQRRLTNHPATDSFPEWLPDGQIAFSSERDGDLDIFVVSANGGEPQKLVDSDGDDWGVDWRAAPTPEAAQPPSDKDVTVGLFSGTGAASACVTAAEHMFEWMGYSIVQLNAQAVNDGDLSHLDILYFPGGSAGPYQEMIDEQGRDKIRESVRSGGCFIGTCAGALYAAEQVIWQGTVDPRETLGLFPGMVQGPIPEIYADPGFGMCQVILEPHTITGTEPDPIQIMYYNSPFFVPNPDAEVDVVGRYEIGGEPALVAFDYGQGRVFLTGPHPEWEEDSERDGVSYFDSFDDQGSEWDLMRQAVQWCLGRADTPPAADPSEAEATTLSSLEQVDGYPLYVMHYYGDYTQRASTPSPSGKRVGSPWACSLFTAQGSEDNMLYGRNFDWEFSPALFLYTDPPDGYASVSMVDIAYLGFSGSKAYNLTDLPLDERRGLLNAPFLPFDGMNNQGLAVGMAAVPPGNVQPDPSKETIGSLGVIRQMLDHASNVNEAVSVLSSYNVDTEGGPPIHYLIADRSGRSVLVEFYQGEMVVIPNEAPWHAATNFLRASLGGSAQGQCWRYDKLTSELHETEGWLSTGQAMNLLAQVAQPGTQWSAVYGMSTGQIDVSMGGQYDAIHTFYLNLNEQ